MALGRRYPFLVLRRALALLAFAGIAATTAAEAPDELPLADLLQVLELDRRLLALDARTGGQLEIRLRLGERVLWKEARGRVGMALSDQRIFAVSVASGAWRELGRLSGEEMPEPARLGDRVALLLTSRRAIGLDGASGNLVEASLGVRERVLASAVGRNVAVVVTDRRALGLSPAAGGFFEAPIHLGEAIESVDAPSNLATVTTSRRLLVFRAPSGSWESRALRLR